jgi:hypothetical protein
MRLISTRCHGIRIAICVAGLVLLGLPLDVCHGQLFKRSESKVHKTGNVSKEELRIGLNDFTDYFITGIKQASEELDEQLPSTKTRKMTLMWRLRASQALFGTLAQDDPMVAFVDVWTLCVRMSDFFEYGNGSELFGAQQKIAREAALTIEREAERIGRSFMNERAFTELKTYIHNLSAKNPIRGVHSFAVYASRSIAEEAGPLYEMLSLPMAPFRALDGVDRGAVAMQRFTDTADRVTDIVELLPESMRWQLLLFLFEMEETELVQSVLKNMDEFSDSSTRLAESAEKLPERLRVQAALLVDEIDKKQANLQETLNRTEKTAAAVARTVVQVDKAALTIDQSAQSVTASAEAWTAAAEATGQMAKAFSKDKEPGQEPAKPFDIQEYQVAMETATETAQQLHALATEIHEIVESEQLGSRIADVNEKAVAVVSRTAAEAQRLADSLTWRVCGLVLLIFCLAVVYRFVAVRVLPKNTTASV